MGRPPAFAACVALAALLLSAGCSDVSFSFRAVPTSEAQYRAYGDSITWGEGLTDKAAQAYPVLVAAREQVTYVNNAWPGDMACDIPVHQIFPHQDSPTLASHPFYTVLIGTNDVGVKANQPSYQTVYIQCHQAVLTWLGVPLEYKSLADGANVTTHGAGALDKTNDWNSWTTQAQGASVSFTLTTAQAGPIYAWPRIDDNSAATYSYALDGKVIGTGAAQTDPKIYTKNERSNSMTLIRIANVPAGKHVVTFTQTNAGTDGVSVVGIGTPHGTIAGTLPTVLAGIIPFEENNGHGGRCTSMDALCNAYIQDIENDVSLLAGDGLHIRIFDTRKYMFATPSEMSDATHPNELGHVELSHSVEAAW